MPPSILLLSPGDICTHLQSMFYLLRPQDTIKVVSFPYCINVLHNLLNFDCEQAVKLETNSPENCRYMAVVSTMGRQDTEESVILGIDIVEEKASVGLVLVVWCDLNVRLDGDG
jgi:protein phosphatase slingshot